MSPEEFRYFVLGAVVGVAVLLAIIAVTCTFEE